ncbi:MOSC domain-containing protein [Sinisalibacter aestuarii]|uniref:Molybdenum cofactor sulfurase n=1 Tax=Sinisalibacter aestuarii TaxID=2949426 RepID=A0ABQ5LTP1_9RHOB|nr:MOSC domain-containing protein [Sinisalibacter aestuarii]GKY87472.1 molybdenum cofactor sulfurase [Sinisalibacter aestuarii]
MTRFVVAGVRTGRIAPLGSGQVLSGIDKHCRTGRVMARQSGLDGDEQGDTTRHGGPDKALHAYPVRHYRLWAEELPLRAARFRPGAFGENLVIGGATEADLCLFDIYRLGGAVVEVSQLRQPCWKLDLRFDLPDMARRVQDSGRTGWYFRVVTEGEIASGDTAELIARPQPGWPLDRVWRLLYRETLDREALAAFAALAGLPDNWRRMAANRLRRGRVEDWRPRLDRPG